MTIVLYTASGVAVERVAIPDPGDEDWPALVAWGSRFFVRRDDGGYYETPCLQVYTERERAAMARGG